MGMIYRPFWVKRMGAADRRHELSDRAWALLESYLPGQAGQWGRVPKDNRPFINAVFWNLRTGAPWRDLPAGYGDWKNVHRRFCRWRDKGIWEKLLEHLIDEPDYEGLMIDASHCKVHPHAAGARGGNQGMDRTKGGSSTKIHLAVDAHGLPLRVLITEGTQADCKQATARIEGMRAEHLNSLTKVTIARPSLSKRAAKACKRKFLRVKIERPSVMTTDTCTPNTIWLRTTSCISSSGAELRRDMLRICPPS